MLTPAAGSSPERRSSTLSTDVVAGGCTRIVACRTQRPTAGGLPVGKCANAEDEDPTQKCKDARTDGALDSDIHSVGSPAVSPAAITSRDYDVNEGPESKVRRPGGHSTSPGCLVWPTCLSVSATVSGRGLCACSHSLPLSNTFALTVASALARSAVYKAGEEEAEEGAQGKSTEADAQGKSAEADAQRKSASLVSA